MMGLEYTAAAGFNPIACSSGKTVTGKSAVADMGMASVTHHMAIQAVRANTFCAAGSRPSKGMRPITRKARGPAIRASICFMPRI